MDWFKQAQDMTNEWLKTQQSVLDSYSKNIQDGGSKKPNDSPFENNPVMAMLAESSQRLAQQYTQAMSPVKPKTTQDYYDDSEKAVESTLTEIWSNNEKFWKSISNNTAWNTETKNRDTENENYFEILTKTMSPEYWTTNAFNNPAIFDRTFSDNPAFAGVTNLDRKLASAADKWNTLQKEISDYSNIVMQTWVKAYEEFCDDTEEKIKSEIPPTSWKDLTDNWLNIANQALVEMQKSEGYLATQKKAIDANSEYRLAEQTIVEEYCKLYHLPTRSEIDDLHKKVYELNKELRELRKAKRQKNQSSTSKTSSTRKPTAKTNADR